MSFILLARCEGLAGKCKRIHILPTGAFRCGLTATVPIAGARLAMQHLRTFSRVFRADQARQQIFGAKDVRWQSIRSKSGTTTSKARWIETTRLLKLAKPEKYTILAAIGCLIVSSAITMSVPMGLGKIIDTMFKKENTSAQTKRQLAQITMTLSCIFIIGGLANYGRIYLFNSASLRIVRDLRSALYRTMLMQEVGWFDTKGTGELVNRLSNDTTHVANALSQNLSDGLRSASMITVGVGMMIYTSPQLAMASTFVMPAMASIALIYGRYVRSITRKMLDKYADISKNAEERFSNVKTVKTFCREYDEARLYDKQLDEVTDLAYQDVHARSLFFGTAGFSGNIVLIAVFYYGGGLVVDNELTLGALTSFLLYSGYAGMSLNSLSKFYAELNKGIGAATRIWEILDRPDAVHLNLGVRPKKEPNGAITFDNVSFAFPTRPQNLILQNIYLELQPGQTTAIVGRSGSGKTTIASLLLRLYDPQCGRVLLDGEDLRALNPQWLRSHIAAVSQEPVLFSGSIRENILYGLNPGDSVSNEKFKEIVAEAHIDEFVEKLPDGLETTVGQRGIMLSGGQKQRVAIARALIKNPKILILDEATSALDSVSEQLVHDALERLVEGRTVLTIAHRLSTISNADKIAVLNNGHIVEEGTYIELINNKDGTFRELVAKQAFMPKPK